MWRGFHCGIGKPAVLADPGFLLYEDSGQAQEYEAMRDLCAGRAGQAEGRGLADRVFQHRLSKLCAGMGSEQGFS